MGSVTFDHSVCEKTNANTEEAAEHNRTQHHYWKYGKINP
jgi:hypothetical protein